MIHVVVTMKVAKGRMPEFLAACKEVRTHVLREKGCHGYEHTREIASSLGIQEAVDPDRITLVERWETMQDLVAHGKAPHMAPFAAAVKGLRESVTARVSESIFLGPPPIPGPRHATRVDRPRLPPWYYIWVGYCRLAAAETA